MSEIVIDDASLKEIALSKIADKKCTRKDVAQTMSLIVRAGTMSDEDRREIMRAIMGRWSVSGAEYILKLAWSGKAFENAN